MCRLARSLCLAGAASANVPAIETVFPAFRDGPGAPLAAAARREGFCAMLAIHPAQVPIINEMMTPSPAELAYAARVVELFAANPGAGVVALDGKMLDLPHLKQAYKISLWRGIVKARLLFVNKKKQKNFIDLGLGRCRRQRPRPLSSL